MNGSFYQAVMRAARRTCLRIVLGALVLALGACTAAPSQSQPKLVFHSFSFDGKGSGDQWGASIDLLEYSYGDKYRMVRDKVEPPRERLGPQSGVTGAMPVGDFLYVKWRVKATGEVREDRVDLRPLLPADMDHHRLTFVIENINRAPSVTCGSGATASNEGIGRKDEFRHNARQVRLLRGLRWNEQR